MDDFIDNNQVETDMIIFHASDYDYESKLRTQLNKLNSLKYKVISVSHTKETVNYNCTEYDFIIIYERPITTAFQPKKLNRNITSSRLSSY
jgi:hypothetical protein